MHITNYTAIVQRQLDAYNRHDLPSFLDCYSQHIAVYRPSATTASLSGKAAFAKFYATQRFNKPGLHAELLNRIVLGNKIIDHERITGVYDQAIEFAVVYEILEGLIQTVWTFGVE